MKLSERLKRNQKFQKGQIHTFQKILGSERQVNALDIGCNEGFWSYVGAINFENIYLCDVFSNCRVNDFKSTNINFVKADGTFLPFNDETFDFVFSIDVIEHVDDYETIFKEHMRVCKSSGRILIGTPNLNRPANILLKLLGRLKFPRKLGEDLYGDVVHIREYSYYDLLDLIAKNDDSIKHFNIYPYYLGIGLKVGIINIPSFLNKYCQFWFVEVIKR